MTAASDIDWRWCWEAGQNALKYVIILTSLHFLWVFKRRVQTRVARDMLLSQRLERASRREVVYLDKAVQWDPLYNISGELITSQLQTHQRSGSNFRSISEKRNSLCEGVFVAKKLQTMVVPLSRRSSDNQRAAAAAVVNLTKMQNGHVNSLKMRFEEEEMPAKVVKVVNSYVPIADEAKKDTQNPELAEVVFRLKEPVKMVTNRSSYNVDGFDDILSQQCFSRSISQYSISDLHLQESSSEINKLNGQFDQLFNRSSCDFYSHGD